VITLLPTWSVMKTERIHVSISISYLPTAFLICLILLSASTLVGAADQSGVSEGDRLEQEVGAEATRIVSVSDVKNIAEKISRLQAIQRAYPARLAWKQRATSSLKRDIETILGLSDDKQRHALDAWRSVRYALDDFKKGNKMDAAKATALAASTLEEILGEESGYYLLALDFHIGMLDAIQPSTDVAKLADRVVKLRAKTLGPDHPFTATAIEVQAMTNLHCKEWKQAGELFSLAIETREKIYGKDYPENARAELGLILSLLGRNEIKAAKILLSGFGISRKEMIDKNGRIRTDFYISIMRVEAAEGRFEQAQAVQEKVLTSIASYMPRNDPSVLEQVDLLRTLLAKQGKVDSVSALETEWNLIPISPKK
jgi:tetratricopeptide (TPR) repeat protein